MKTKPDRIRQHLTNLNREDITIFIEEPSTSWYQADGGIF